MRRVKKITGKPSRGGERGSLFRRWDNELMGASLKGKNWNHPSGSHAVTAGFHGEGTNYYHGRRKSSNRTLGGLRKGLFGKKNQDDFKSTRVKRK